MTPLELICVIGALTIFVFVVWWFVGQDCGTTTDQYIIEQLIDLDQGVKKLKVEIKGLRNDTK